MRIVCNSYGLDLLLEENCVTELLIDSPEHFQSFLYGLLEQYNGGDDYIIISEADKNLRLNKVAEIITDPFHVDVNNRKILTQLYCSMIRESMDTNLEMMLQLQTAMEKFVIEVCEQSEYSLSYNSNPDFSDLLKLYNVHIDIDGLDLASKLLSYIKLSHRILNTSLYIFVNLKAFFSNEVLEQLFKTICYEKVNILLVERYDSSVLEHEKRVIIDKDACIIYDE